MREVGLEVLGVKGGQIYKSDFGVGGESFISS